MADADRLMQVMNNLLSNAAKFEPEGGTVRLEATRNNQGIRVSVIDHGPGIPGDFAEHIFDKFTQVDGTDTRKTPGTGLGLSIAKAIIEHHQGQIGFASEEGHDACFYFVIPAASDAAKAP